jgi:hypothetical protein
MTKKPRDNIATRRALQGRKPNGEKMIASPAMLEKLTQTAQYLANLPEDMRAAAALRAFPPSKLREAIYRHAKGDTVIDACLKTGVSPAAFELFLRSDEAGQELRQVMAGVLENEYAPNAFRFLHETVNDTAMPARVRVDAAKIIVDRAGYVAGAPSANTFDKEIEEMGINELTALVADLRSKRAAAAKDITPVEDEVENDGRHLDDAPQQPH